MVSFKTKNKYTVKYEGRRVSPFGAMRIAAIAAREGLGTVSPNPAVGCTILDGNYRVLSVGRHLKAGEDHAEIDAINQLPKDYDFSKCHFHVTLEPCSHQGKTGSCAKKIAKLNINSLVYGLKDPNQLVNGRGLEMLQASGIKVFQVDEVSEKTSADKKEKHHKELLRLTESFFKNVTEEKPFVSLKVACSLDGQIGLQSGESQWITSESSRRHGHAVRAKHDAILIGVDTFLNDNPSLNIRYGRLANRKHGKNLKVIVIDPSGRGLNKLEGSNLLKHHNKNEIFWILAADITVEELDINFIKIQKTKSNEIDINNLMIGLLKKGITSILIEGGAKTVSSFLRQKQVDRLYQYMAPSIIGDSNGKTWSESLSTGKLSEKIEIKNPIYKRIKDNLFITGEII